MKRFFSLFNKRVTLPETSMMAGEALEWNGQKNIFIDAICKNDLNSFKILVSYQCGVLDRVAAEKSGQRSLAAFDKEFFLSRVLTAAADKDRFEMVSFLKTLGAAEVFETAPGTGVTPSRSKKMTALLNA